VATSAQVRIARDKIDGLIHLLLTGRGMPQRPDAFVTRALSVRLRAPDGGFWIEHTSPETVWVDTASGIQQDEQATWRWTVTPQARGRGRLVLLVTARTVGRDGIAAESAPPDRAIEVMVRGNPLRSLVRWTGLLALVLAGVALGTYGHEIWEAAAAMIKTFAGG
jgi:neural Wiskott-Aldrich syndrome protein